MRIVTLALVLAVAPCSGTPPPPDADTLTLVAAGLDIGALALGITGDEMKRYDGCATFAALSAVVLVASAGLRGETTCEVVYAETTISLADCAGLPGVPEGADVPGYVGRLSGVAVGAGRLVLSAAGGNVKADDKIRIDGALAYIGGAAAPVVAAINAGGVADVTIPEWRSALPDCTP